MVWSKYLKSRRIWFGIIFVLILIALRFTPLHDYITVQTLQEKRFHLLQLVQDDYINTVLEYISIYILIVLCAIPLAGLGTVMGGFLFGVVPGAFYATIGATIGGTLFFLIVRYVLGRILQERYSSTLQHINKELEDVGVLYLVTFRFIMAVPFFIENIVLGLTNISVWTFIWTTALGVFPGSLVYAFAGKQLTTVKSMGDIISLPIVVAFCLLAVLALVPIAIRKYMQRRRQL